LGGGKKERYQNLKTAHRIPPTDASKHGGALVGAAGYYREGGGPCCCKDAGIRTSEGMRWVDRKERREGEGRHVGMSIDGCNRTE